MRLLDRDVVLAKYVADLRKRVVVVSLIMAATSVICIYMHWVTAAVIIAAGIALVWLHWWLLRRQVRAGKYPSTAQDVRDVTRWLERSGGKKTNILSLD